MPLDEVKESAKRKLLYDEARVALKKNDIETAKARCEMFGEKVASREVSGEIRQHHELLGMTAAAGDDLQTARAEFKQADQQNGK